MIKSALSVYHWFVRLALTGSQVVARKPTGEEVVLETAERAVLEGGETASVPKNWVCSPGGSRRRRIQWRPPGSRSGKQFQLRRGNFPVPNAVDQVLK